MNSYIDIRPSVTTRVPLCRAWENGWYKVIAIVKDTLAIYLFLDCAIDKTNRGYWVGFASDKQSEIEEIAEVSQLDVGDPFDDDHPDPPEDRRHPVVEHWREDEQGAYFGVYFEPGSEFDIGRALQFVCHVLRRIPGFEMSVRLDDAGLDIAAIERDSSLTPTTKKQLIDARIGQGVYRQKLEKLWNGKCAVLGIENRRVLRASHVKPWRLSSNAERLDPHNGLLLAAHLDALFDAGLITFSSSGEMIVGRELSGSDRELMNMGSRLRRNPSRRLQSYLTHHRDAHESRVGRDR